MRVKSAIALAAVCAASAALPLGVAHVARQRTQVECALTESERSEICSDLGDEVARLVEQERHCRVPLVECAD